MSEIPDGEPLMFGRDFGWGKVSNKWVIRKTPRGWLARPPRVSFFLNGEIVANSHDRLLVAVSKLINEERVAIREHRTQQEFGWHRRKARIRQESAHLRKARS